MRRTTSILRREILLHQFTLSFISSLRKLLCLTFHLCEDCVIRHVQMPIAMKGKKINPIWSKFIKVTNNFVYEYI